MMQDVERIEKNPQRVWGICQTAMSEGVRRKQIAEFVVNLRLRNPHPGKKRQPDQYRGRTNRRQRCSLISGQAGKIAFHPAENGLAKRWSRPGQADTNRE